MDLVVPLRLKVIPVHSKVVPFGFEIIEYIVPFFYEMSEHLLIPCVIIRFPFMYIMSPVVSSSYAHMFMNKFIFPITVSFYYSLSGKTIRYLRIEMGSKEDALH